MKHIIINFKTYDKKQNFLEIFRIFGNIILIFIAIFIAIKLYLHNHFFKIKKKKNYSLHIINLSIFCSKKINASKKFFKVFEWF